MPRPVLRPLASIAFSVFLIVGSATPVFGWANGGSGGDGYGTHDWVVSQALKVFGDSPPAWLEVDTALKATDDPDKLFWAVNEHVFYDKGYGRGAVDRISEFYHQALTAHAAGDDHTASIAFGWMSHYYADILQPYHTNYAAVHMDASHLAYETRVNSLTRSPDASPEWSTTDRGPHALADIRTSAIAAAAYSRRLYPELFLIFHVNETVLVPRVQEITGLLLKRASSDLANALYSIDQGVGDATPAASASASVRFRYIAQNTIQTIYVTVKDAAGRPLEGVRADVAFPIPTGGTKLLRRFTNVNGVASASANVGASPLSRRRDVAITVKTGDVVKTPTTWFMATRRLAAGTAGFKTWVDDTTVTVGQTVRIGTLARGTGGHRVPNLKIVWTLTFGDGHVQKISGYTDALGRAVTRLPITDSTPLGIVKVSARTQSASVWRTSTASFSRY
ncbi:MAG: hypothetical protein ABI562_01575 [Chloroflexota bacterium]